jgi:hypothetical protein
VKTELRTALSAASLAGFLAAQAISASATTTTCSGNSTATSTSRVLFDLTTGSCAISSEDIFPNDPNQFAFFAAPGSEPDYFWAVKNDSEDFDPAEGLTVDGVDGTTEGGFFNELSQNFTGSIVAVILAKLMGQTYEMTVNLTTDGGNSIAITAASVTAPSPVPLPGAALLLFSGLGGLGALGAMKKRNQKASAAQA